MNRREPQSCSRFVLGAAAAAAVAAAWTVVAVVAVVAVVLPGCDSASAHGPATEMGCVECHQQDWTATADPVHHQSGFGSACGTCHSQTAWRPAPGYQHTAVFPLTGRHAVQTCTACHASPGKLPTECVGCHLAQWQGTTNPNHATSGISQQCQTCHTTSGWSPASGVQHTQFPLSGEHANIACTTCHPAGPGAPFTCFGGGCHGKAQMDKEHLGEVGGYVYDSAKCYSCHPDGKEHD